jgi:hypothetical protein
MKGKFFVVREFIPFKKGYKFHVVATEQANNMRHWSYTHMASFYRKEDAEEYAELMTEKYRNYMPSAAYVQDAEGGESAIGYYYQD